MTLWCQQISPQNQNYIWKYFSIYEQGIYSSWNRIVNKAKGIKISWHCPFKVRNTICFFPTGNVLSKHISYNKTSINLVLMITHCGGGPIHRHGVRPELGHTRVEWCSTFCDFRKQALCCRLGIFVPVQFQKIGEFGRARGKVFFFITGTLQIEFKKSENFQKPSFYLKEQLTKRKLEIKI